VAARARGAPRWAGVVFRSDASGERGLAQLLAGEADLVEALPEQGTERLAASLRMLRHPGQRLADASLDPRKRYEVLSQAMALGLASRALIPLAVPDRVWAARRGIDWAGSPEGLVRAD
jgi:hypothetical protein